jgi:drug/metabolite transporter (DMT)-like permease
VREKCRCCYGKPIILFEKEELRMMTIAGAIFIAIGAYLIARGIKGD